jgi:threonine/homoserine/homoserine lactone efflux protein
LYCDCVLVQVAAFTLAAVLIVLLPGPDTLVVVRNLVRGGRRLAFRTVLGVLSGLMVWVVTAALGLSAVLRASHDGYLGLRIAGACYLIFLGARSLRSGGAQFLEPAAGPRKLRTGYPAGLLTDLLNPKVGVFFVTFLPSFIPHGEPVGYVSLLLGAIFIVLTGIYFVLLLAASKPVLRWLATTHIRRRLDRCTGLVLIGFGLRLALEP